jgi:hypothetical protein
MSGSNPKYFLRPEAGPVPCGKLQSRAQDALKDIIGFLSAAVTSVQISSENTTVDTNRASRIFFVSGEPGSGKSTLYLTLKEMLSDNNAISKKYSDGCTEDISTLKGAVRWLDTLDLEVAGDEGENLLAAVLVRLIDVLTKSDTSSNTILSTSCEEAIKELEELATDIGIAWEGNLRARAGELDPDTYSEEVMRTQRARLRVNERLKETLDKLAKNECYGCHEGTLFVLPVDDFYLKPNASLQLLRLLRMISIPRLFFLVMGDITTVEALFVEKSLADWTAVAGPEIFATLPQRQDEALGRARELRARYLRKLLPPRQRAVIEAMDWDEALRFKPERLNGKETDVDRTPIVDKLRNLLEKRDIDSLTNKSSLFTFLISPPFENEIEQKVESEEERKKKKNIRRAQEAYTALQILDATSREIMDLWFALHDLNNPPKNKDVPVLLSCVLDFVQLVIEEQNFLNEKQQGILFGILPTRHYTEQEIYLDMNRLRLQPEQNTWEELIKKDQSQSESDQSTKEIWIRKHRSWKLGVNTDEGESSEDEGLFAKLPPRQTAWIVLMHDLAWKWNPERVTGNLVEKLCKDLSKWAWSKPKAGLLSKREDNTEIAQFRVKHLIELLAMWKGEGDSAQELELNPSDSFRGWAVWRSGETYKHFEMPEFETFRDLDRFLFIWSSSLEWLRKTQAEANIDTYISLWKLAGWTVLLDAYKDFAEEGDDWYKDFAEGGDKWFEDFMGIKDKPFIEHVNAFKTARHKSFDYPGDGSEQLKAWRRRLDDWGGKQVVKIDNEISEG